MSSSEDETNKAAVTGSLLAMVDGAMTTAAEATVPALDLGFLRGDGVFEVFQLYRGEPFALPEHLARLQRSATATDLAFDRSLLEDEIARLLDAIGDVDGNVRVIVTRGGARILLQEPSLDPPARYRLALVPHLVSPLLAGVKSLSYAANCQARRLAQAQGCDDALLVSASDGQILEGPTISFAWAEAGRLYTPPLSAGILDSITRRVLLDATGAQERRCTRAELERAEGACVMGTGLEVIPVGAIKDVCAFPETVEAIRSGAEAVSRLVQERLARSRARAES